MTLGISHLRDDVPETLSTKPARRDLQGAHHEILQKKSAEFRWQSDLVMRPKAARHSRKAGLQRFPTAMAFPGCFQCKRRCRLVPISTTTVGRMIAKAGNCMLCRKRRALPGHTPMLCATCLVCRRNGIIFQSSQWRPTKKTRGCSPWRTGQRRASTRRFLWSDKASRVEHHSPTAMR